MKRSRAIICSRRPLPNILKYLDHQGDLPRNWKKQMFSHTLLVHRKEAISMSHGCSKNNWKPLEDEWRLTRYVRGIYIYINYNRGPLIKFSSTKFKYILPWNMSVTITKTALIITIIVISRAISKRHFLLNLKTSMETRTATSEFPNGEKATTEQIIGWE